MAVDELAIKYSNTFSNTTGEATLYQRKREMAMDYNTFKFISNFYSFYSTHLPPHI